MDLLNPKLPCWKSDVSVSTRYSCSDINCTLYNPIFYVLVLWLIFIFIILHICICQDIFLEGDALSQCPSLASTTTPVVPVVSLMGSDGSRGCGRKVLHSEVQGDKLKVDLGEAWPVWRKLDTIDLTVTCYSPASDQELDR